MVRIQQALLALALMAGFALAFSNVSGCASGGSQIGSVPLGSDAPSVDTPPSLALPERNVLRTDMPALGALAPGAEFDFTVHAEMSEPLFQGSFRILYDPAVVQVLSSSRGDFVPSGSVFMCRVDSPPNALPSPDSRLTRVIPCAFTARPGETGATPGRGTLLTLRFRLLARPTGASCVRMLNDATFLQLRGSQGQRLRFDLGTEEVSK